MSTLNPQVEVTSLGTYIRAVLERFETRPVDGALVAELADALNQELVSFRAGRRIELRLDGSAIRVELTTEWTIGTGADERAPASIGFDAVAAALAA